MSTQSPLPLAVSQSLGLSGLEIYSVGYSLLKALGNKGVLLDFGSGRGKFLEGIKDLGFSYMVGVDLMDRPEALSSNCQWIQCDLNNRLPVSDNTYDVIMAMEVIEHLENPRATVREWKRLLKPGGTLIFSTPNNGSLRSLIALALKGHFVSFLDKDYPAHITALTKLDMKRILEENQFKNIQFQFTEKGLVPGLKGMTWQNLSLGFLRGEKFSDNIFAIATKT